VIHLGERDCSVQRRHQKLIEEAPSPAVDAALRERMGETAVTVARELGYTGAGTVEFLLDRDGRYYFMEMNTRLQVEHPVTEAITGLDLVEWQFRVARGEPLAWSQRDVAFTGHAIEVRLCAESPADDFLPGSGRVADWHAPTGVRCDHALEAGTEVTAWYDSMVAKLVAHAPTRAECIERLADALDHTVLLGLPGNRDFLAKALRHDAFRAGRDVSTAFIARHFGEGASRAAAADDRTWALAAWLSVAAAPETLATCTTWRHWSTGRPLPQPWRLRVSSPVAAAPGSPPERHGRVTLDRESGVVETGETRHAITGTAAAARTDARTLIDGASLDYRYAWDGATLWLHTVTGDFAFECRRRSAARDPRAESAESTVVRSSINGRVVAVAAQTGTVVQRGDPLVVLEAMKMEHEVRAIRAGRISAVDVRAGDQVAPGHVLVHYEVEA
jgi:geranyl-CoA carboxylase alpha subunit